MKNLILTLTLLISAVSFGQTAEEYKQQILSEYNKNIILNYEKLSSIKIPLISVTSDDVNYIPCVVNGIYDYFVFDTGCTAGLVLNMNTYKKILNTGNVLYEDYLGTSTIQTAANNYEVVKVVVMNEVIIGQPNNAFKLNNVLAVIYNSDEGPLLFGQDIINRFSSVTIDNKNGTFIFKK